MEPLACVTHGVESAGVKLGDTVVVNGAGPIGLMYVALLVKKGAYVIATDLSDVRLETAKKLGAAKVVNASGKDTVELVKALTPEGRGCDIAIEAAGYPEVWEKIFEWQGKEESYFYLEEQRPVQSWKLMRI